MRTRKLLAKTLELLELESRAELEHVVNCDHCDLDDGGWYCREFRMRFRGWTPSRSGQTLVAISPVWTKTILAALQRNIVLLDRSQDVHSAADGGADESLSAQEGESAFD